MKIDFASHIEHFSLVVDDVSEDTFNSIIKTIKDFHDEPRIGMPLVHLGILRRKLINQKTGMINSIPELNRSTWNNQIKNPTGGYTGQSSFAFAMGQPIWIQASGSSKCSTLQDCDAYQDLLGNAAAETIPDYNKETGQDLPVKTSIIYPLTLEDRDELGVLGVINFEFKEKIQKNDCLEAHFKKLADSVARLEELRFATKFRDSGTRKAKGLLSYLKQAAFSSKKTIFLAYPKAADNGVVGIIKETLDSCLEDHKVIDWIQMPQSGPIMAQLLEEIWNSSFAVFYFSETDTANQGRFLDNHNVMFEAGIANGLLGASDSPLAAWIPVREEFSNEIPFDLVGERILKVARENDGALNLQLFKSDLEGRIKGLLADHPHINRAEP